MFFPDIDIAGGTVTFAIWQSAILAGLLLLFVFLAIYRAEWPTAVGPAIRVMLVLLGIGAVWTFLDRMAGRDQADARRAIDQRIEEMSARALTPGSPLGCLETDMADAIEGFCEQAIFAGPDTVAAATAYVTASLSLLADGMANGLDADYDATLAALRRRLQSDRFGFVAHALAAQGCSAAKCEKFALFADTRGLSANLASQSFDMILARHSAGWPQSTAPVASSAPAAPVGGPAPVGASPPPAPAKTVGIDFPSAASIPPVSIMTDEPKEPVSPAGSNAAAQKRAPPPARTVSRPGAPAPAPAAPIQIGPPAANAGAVEPPAQ